MINVSDEIKQAYENSTTQIDKIILNGEEHIVTNVEYYDDVYSDGNIFGTAIAKCLDFEIDGNVNIEGKEFEYLTGVKINDTIQWISLGNFIVQTVEPNDTTLITKVAAMDYMLKSNIPYVTELNYASGTVTLLQVLQEACINSGLTLSTTNFANSNFIVDSNQFSDGTLIRQVIQAIAQISGTVAKIKNNQLYLLTPSTTVAKVFTLNNYTEAEIKRTTHPINLVSLGMTDVEGENITLRDETSISKNGENSLVINDNPFAYTQAKREQLITALFNAVKGFEYKSYSIKCQGLPYLETLDKIQLPDKEGNLYNSYVFRFNYKSPKGLESTIEAPSITQATVVYQNVPSALDVAKRAEYKVDKQEGKITQLSSTVENITTITHTTEEAYQHTLENSADSYCKDVELYGESIQNGEPTPNTPAEILSPGKNIEIKSVGSDSEQNISTIQLPDKLRSTPSDYPAERIRDRIYKENGKWYYEKRMNHLICDGSEDWQIWSFGSSVVERFYFIVDEPSLNSYAFSNMLPYMSGNEEQSHIRMGGTNWGDITLYISLSIASTVEELKTWLASNNLEVQYPLAELIITEITDEDTIYALEHIKTYAGSTEITSDVLLKLEYYTNTAFNKEYETKQNATKQYNTTIEKFAQQEITNESIQQEVSETKTTIQNDYQTKEEASTQYTQLSQKFEFDVNAAISDLKDNGVPKVVSSIITIDENGLTSGRSDSEYYNVMNNTGNYQYNAGQLLAKYDKDGAEIPRLKSDIGVIAGVKHVKETINGVVHHRTYAID